MSNEDIDVIAKKPLNDALREGARQYASRQRDEVRKKLSEIMKVIDIEIKSDKNNIYPHNHGKLNQREVCRRAGIHHQTLQQPAHKDTTKLEVQRWCDGKNSKTKAQVRKVVSGKADYWQEQHQMVTTQIYLYELELNERDVAIRELKEQSQNDMKAHEEEIARLKKENAVLRLQVSKLQKGHNVASIHSKGS